MNDNALIAAMARTLVDYGVDLTNDRAAIMCLVGACYYMIDISICLDQAIARAHRIREARQVLQVDAALRAAPPATEGGHAA